ncbi:hypothetical protein BOTBODRAFT_215964 [Botryobasidium botryosum FD-172 SS1]|uniref:Uncharacterized protein n=1 Tax=Botryobasidium botryosum (strain FD-172 SS1) TaxID=930990 RepID=A0A067N4K5_BOTB1|nr:hypothetical protein BOTBODRAFT_215964 [Botryobasidium botryosum FD-172 SS1]
MYGPTHYLPDEGEIGAKLDDDERIVRSGDHRCMRSSPSGLSIAHPLPRQYSRSPSRANSPAALFVPQAPVLVDPSLTTLPQQQPQQPQQPTPATPARPAWDQVWPSSNLLQIPVPDARPARTDDDDDDGRDNESADLETHQEERHVLHSLDERHILTIFMDDLRAGESNPDHLLAEVVVSLRPDTDGPGWWVSADEMIARLQETPGRIDGPAKISTRRGKYRHCFVRLTTTQMERCNPSALRVAQDKSLELIIEPNPLGKRALSPPAHPSHPMHSLTISRAPKRVKSETLPTPLTPGQSDHSPYDASGPFTHAPLAPLPTSASAPKVLKSTKKNDTNAVIATWLREKIGSTEVAYYEDFIKSKGRVLPVDDLLRVYRFAQRMLDQYNDTRTPHDLPGAPDKKISKANVLHALGRQTSWGSDCESTLQLVDMYGPGGPRETPKIVDLIGGVVGSGEKEGSVFFLYALKAVDKAWKSGGPDMVKEIDYTQLAKKKGGGKLSIQTASPQINDGASDPGGAQLDAE